MNYRVTREFEFCYGHRLLNYAGKCRNLHGHNGRVSIAFETDRLNMQGMAIDFTEIKRSINTWIDESLDHRMLLHKDDPLVEILTAEDEPIVVFEDNPTAENIARLIYDFASSEGFPVVEVRLWESSNCSATYG